MKADPPSSMRSKVGDFFTVLLAICAVIVTILVVRREFTKPKPVVLPNSIIENWRDIAAVGIRTGDLRAPVVLVEFSDFQCPFCAGVQDRLRAAKAKYGDQITMVFRHYPLQSIHPFAFAAALAAECANEQDRFPTFKDVLFENQRNIGVSDWDWFAREAGVPDLGRFGECVHTMKYDSNVTRDLAVARELKLNGTPSILVNETHFGGTPSAEELDHVIAKALAQAPGELSAQSGR